MDQSAKPANRFSSKLFFFVIALAPLPFGSADPTSISFWCLALAISLAFSNPGYLSAAQKMIVGGILLLLSIFCAVILFQILSPPLWGNPDPIWAKAKELLGDPISPAIAVMRSAPLYSLGPTFACALSILLGVLLGSDRRRAHQILMVFAWSGLAYAAYGIISALVEPTMILWQEREGYFGNVIGTFTYRNTAATYFGSCSVIWLLTVYEVIKNRLPRQRFTWKHFSQKILSEAHLDVVISFIGFFICVMALLMTTSRAGTVISLFALAGISAVYFKDELPKKRGRLFFIAGSVLTILLGLQLFAGSLGQRFETSGLSDEGRFTTYQATLRMIADHPWLGTGLGTFPWAFPEYRSAEPSMFGVWTLAHSTPLELIAEMGIPTAALISVAWLCGIAILIRGALVRRRDIKIPLAAAAIALISLVHSSIDFGLQISGYAIVAMAVIGAGLSQSFRSDRITNTLDRGRFGS